MTDLGTGGVRTQLEARERETLAPFATLSSESRGRLRAEEEDAIRPAFQRDRDRIVHSKAFRRLKHKTQVSSSYRRSLSYSTYTHT